MRSINLSLGSIKIVLISAVVALCACSKPEPVYVQSPVQQQQIAPAQLPQQTQAAPQVVYQQVPAQAQPDNSTRDMLLGGVAGYMLGSRGGGGGAAPSPSVIHNTTVVNKTIVNQRVTRAPTRRK